jgi:hypothetical protein
MFVICTSADSHEVSSVAFNYCVIVCKKMLKHIRII